MVSLALAGVGGACGTNELDTNRTVVSASEVNDTAVGVSLAGDYDTYEQEQAAVLSGDRSQDYQVRIDGRAAVWSEGTQVAIYGGGTVYIFVPAGQHVIALTDKDGRTVVQTDPVQLLEAHSYRLVAFGKRPALQQTFFEFDLDIPERRQRFAILNLVRGQTIEAVDCPGLAPDACTILSEPLGYGESLQGEASYEPVDPAGGNYQPSPNIGYRTPPSAEEPTPPVTAAYSDDAASNLVRRTGTFVLPPFFLGIPVYMFDGGYTVSRF